MSKPMPDLVIFDCDGTLVDTEKVQLRVQSQILSDLGLDLDEDYFAAHLTGKRFTTILEQLSASHGLQAPPETAALFKTRYWEALETEDTAIPHARETVLQMNGLTKVCIASNGSHPGIRKHMQRLDLMPPLTDDTIFSAVDIGVLKPAPGIFLHAMREMGVADPAKVVVVEDSYTGLRAGLAAGMAVVWLRRDGRLPVPEEFSGRVAIIDDLAHLGGTPAFTRPTRQPRDPSSRYRPAY